MTGGQTFSKLDLSSAYLQLPLEEESQKYTTINTPKGLYVYTRIPFGINSALGIFQRTLDSTLGGIPNMAVYLDDILVTGPTHEVHITHLKSVLQCLLDSGLRVKKEKCSFFQSSVNYLGHVIDHEGVHPDTQKLQGINDMSTPKNVSELSTYLGIVNYYNKFIPNSSTVLKPLYDLLHKDVKWNWASLRNMLSKKVMIKIYQSSCAL